MRRRVFLAINLDTRTVREIEKLVADCERLLPPEFLKSIRFLKSENWHITLSFLAYQDEDSILKIVKAAGVAAAGFPPQKIELNKLLYGPPGKNPRMIWILANPETSQRLSEIKNVFEDGLEELGVAFKREKRKFHAHITLARFEGSLRWSLLPPVDKLPHLNLEVQNLDLMESELKRGGAEYTIMQRFPFGR